MNLPHWICLLLWPRKSGARKCD